MNFIFFKSRGFSVLILLGLLYLFGYTHLLGGPFGLARFFFIIILIGTILLLFVFWKMWRLARKIFQASSQNDFSGERLEATGEIIEVDSTLVEEEVEKKIDD
jgi:uncharacterized membrane protein